MKIANLFLAFLIFPQIGFAKVGLRGIEHRIRAICEVDVRDVSGASSAKFALSMRHWREEPYGGQYAGKAGLSATLKVLVGREGGLLEDMAFNAIEALAEVNDLSDVPKENELFFTIQDHHPVNDGSFSGFSVSVMASNGYLTANNLGRQGRFSFGGMIDRFAVNTKCRYTE